ncbi:MAG TPA: RagB/SusD family nutrient uptake outer membrane protein, partial [Sphingobacterium sp.]|nr:RagB/SusD family nutrient uptake outer membrane protein [Sphingobacterium sp.]
SSTGYTTRKNIHPTFSRTPAADGPGRPAMYIRLAELYLSYAEALNESNPTHGDVLTYLNAVRTRAGLPALSGLSQDQMREQIRRERQIELAFEGHRYFDVRRWKVADRPGYYQGGEYHGMDITKGSTLSDPAFHTRVVAVRRARWNSRFYFLPFLQSEMDRNKELVQLPGY